jgi:dihydroorotase
MTLHLPQALLIFPGHAQHNQRKDVWLHEGKLWFNNEGLPQAETLESGLCVSPGWVDMQARTYEPGYEVRETIATVSRAALHGGFTTVAVLPNTNPVVDGREGVGFLKNEGKKHGLEILPIGAITQGAKGEKLAEMLDMHHAGAVAFSDGKPVVNPDIVLKTLQYLQHVNGLLIQRAEEPKLAAFGQMHEGLASLLLGLEGIPEIAEYLIVNRDLQLLEHTGGRIHFSLVSSPKSIEYIQEARESGLQVSCSMAAHQLCFTDEALGDFDTNYKVSPPFRTEAINAQLKKALLAGAIDVVVSDHNPWTTDNKKCEFDLAESGISTIETAFHSLLQTLGTGNETLLVNLLAVNPRKILGLPMVEPQNGQSVNLTIFSTEGETEINRAFFQSKSYNSPFMGKTLPGRVIGTYAQGVWTQVSTSIKA